MNWIIHTFDFLKTSLSGIDMTAEEALSFINTIVQPHYLSNIQDLVFRQCWEGKTYSQIASVSDYNPDYLREVGAQVWQLLSEKLNKKVTKNNLYSILTQHQVIAKSIVKPFHTNSFTTTRRADWGEAIDIPFFCGRNSELLTLEKWILSDSSQEKQNQSCRMISLEGISGVGKTSLAVKIAQQVQDQFDFLIWRSLRNSPSIEDILTQWIQFLSHQEKIINPSNLDDKIICLLHYLRISRCLLVLDNFESILQTGDPQGRYRDKHEGYGQLLRSIGETSHQSCLIITSREKPIGLAAKESKNLSIRSVLLNNLCDPAN